MDWQMDGWVGGCGVKAILRVSCINKKPGHEVMDIPARPCSPFPRFCDVIYNLLLETISKLKKLRNLKKVNSIKNRLFCSNSRKWEKKKKEENLLKNVNLNSVQQPV